MRMADRQNRKGFVLLLIVAGGFIMLFCGGMGSLVLVPAVNRYMHNAHSYEAINTTRTMANYAVTVYERACEFPAELDGTIDARKCCGAQQCTSKKTIPDTWAGSTTQLWEPSYFSYSAKHDGDTLRISAVSDFQCDGPMHTLTVTVKGVRNGTACTASYDEPVTTHELE